MSPPSPILPLLLILTLFLYPCSPLHCSSGCKYYYNTGTSAYTKGCTVSSLINRCTKCDQNFYTLSGTTCSLNSRGIFNTSVSVSNTTWSSDSNVGSATIDSKSDWLQFTADGQVNAVIRQTDAIYGYQCRILMHVTQDSSFWPTIYFMSSGNNLQQIQLLPQLQSSSYSFQQWIFTTKFIQTSSPQFLLSLFRNDSTTNPTGDVIAFKDVRCLIAKCVLYCTQCTGLQDCSGCQSGYMLQRQHRWCVAACPIGQYSYSTSVCEYCDVLCSQCTGTSSNCSSCHQQGPYQSFLLSSYCYVSCPNGTIANYSTHTCECPLQQSYYIISNICYSCNYTCKQCYGPNSTNCTECQLGYYLNNNTNTCTQVCPAGEYVYLVYDVSYCYLCNSTLCTTCVNQSYTCTSCTSLTLQYLYDHECVSLCPDGYQGNNSTHICDACPLSMYSFQNVCYSQCPSRYTADSVTHACVISNGYPWNVSIQVEDKDTLKFVIHMEKGISSSNLTVLNSSWSSVIEVYYVETEQLLMPILNKATLEYEMLTNTFQQKQNTNNNNRLLYKMQNSLQKLPISSSTITNKTLTLYTTQISAQQLKSSLSIRINFTSNIVSPLNVIYQIYQQNTTDSNPKVIKQYYNLNLSMFYLVGTVLGVLTLLLMLVQVKNMQRVLLQFLQCLQVVGLCLYSIYPTNLNTYSLVLGFDFCNFSFMYNIFSIYLSECSQCVSLTGYSFVFGDMNYTRMIGSVIASTIVVLLLASFVYLFEYSRKYGQFIFRLIGELVLVQVVHSWFASLVYVGLNYQNTQYIMNYQLILMHLVSYVVLVPVLLPKFKKMKENNHPNISLVFLFVYICLLVVVSLSKILICCLLIFLSMIQCLYMYLTNTTEDDRPATQLQMKFSRNQQFFIALLFHNILYRILRPITMFLIACILLLNSQTYAVIIISLLMGLFFFSIIFDAKLNSKYRKDFGGKAEVQEYVEDTPQGKDIMGQSAIHIEPMEVKKQRQYGDYGKSARFQAIQAKVTAQMEENQKKKKNGG